MPKPLDQTVSRRMSKQRRRDTAPERRLRSQLHRRGLRFRVDRPPVPGMRSRADIVFTRAKVAVFVDGCFWRVCPDQATWPENNKEWWAEKLNSNVERDRRVDETLAEAGWVVVRVWEHEDPAVAAERVQLEVSRRRGFGEIE